MTEADRQALGGYEQAMLNRLWRENTLPRMEILLTEIRNLLRILVERETNDAAQDGVRGAND